MIIITVVLVFIITSIMIIILKPPWAHICINRPFLKQKISSFAFFGKLIQKHF